MKKNEFIYKKLQVSLQPKHIVGESFYYKMLDDIVNDLLQKKIAVKLKQSVIVFINKFKNRHGQPMGVIIKKKDEGYLYSTIDIACLKYRYQILHADRILYYIDSRQKQHLQQVFIIAKKAGYIPNHFTLEHHMFGMVLSKNKRPFKTRDGKNIHLSTLIEEAKIKAKKIILKKNNNINKKNLDKLSAIIGIGAIKYADLSQNRTTDYVFDWNKMLNFNGNTSLYIQYAYVRIIAIFRKTHMSHNNLKEKILLENSCEKQLAIKILQFEEIIVQVAKDGTPNLMCNYLYNLSVLFSKFYENYSVLSCNKEKILKSRLKLLLIISKILKKGLFMLGIKTIDNM